MKRNQKYQSFNKYNICDRNLEAHIKSKENKNSRNYMYTNFLLDKQ